MFEDYEFPALDILDFQPGFLKAPARNNQETYQDPARSWIFIWAIQEEEMKKLKISNSVSYHIPLLQ